MNILLIEPYYTGSHKYWADNLVKFSTHKVHLMTMKGRFWKWRLQGSSIYLAKKFQSLKKKPDLIICSSMMDVATFRSLIALDLNKKIPIIYYAHENQLTYPFSRNEERLKEDFHYGFLNYKSCLAADRVLFNSKYHKESFLSALKSLLTRLPDYSLLSTLDSIEQKSHVSIVGIDIDKIDSVPFQVNEIKLPTLLWNNRWDDDKNPKLFLRLCRYLNRKQIKFNLILLGEKGNESEHCSTLLEKEFSKYILHSGYVKDYSTYINLIRRSSILPVCSDHDFYGISVMEAVINGVLPILPIDKVYQEFIPVSFHRDLYYSSHEEFFLCVEKNLKVKRQIKLENQAIHKAIEIIDLHIIETINL